jgi:hypothetical protein
MRRIRYAVVASLDRYIAGPKGEPDWIIMDPDIDFDPFWAQFDTLLIGRRTFEVMTEGKKKGGATPGMTFHGRTINWKAPPRAGSLAPGTFALRSAGTPWTFGYWTRGRAHNTAGNRSEPGGASSRRPG